MASCRIDIDFSYRVSFGLGQPAGETTFGLRNNSCATAFRHAVQRVRCFRTFAMNVSPIDDSDGEPVEMKIEEMKEAANRGGLKG
jgi:hypothetical protein